MAKIQTHKFIKSHEGKIEGQAIASIHKQSHPLIIGRNLYGINLQAPYYHKTPRSKAQQQHNQTFQKCARMYSFLNTQTKQQYRQLALQHSKKHNYQHPMTAYTLFVQICMAKQQMLKKIQQIQLTDQDVNTNKAITVLLQKPALLWIQCKGQYTAWDNVPLNNVDCLSNYAQPQHNYKKWTYAQCNLYNTYNQQQNGIHITIDEADYPIAHLSHGSNFFPLPFAKQKMELRMLTTNYGTNHAYNLSYTLYTTKL